MILWANWLPGLLHYSQEKGSGKGTIWVNRKAFLKASVCLACNIDRVGLIWKYINLIQSLMFDVTNGIANGGWDEFAWVRDKNICFSA